jgi:CBS domain-containing protein
MITVRDILNEKGSTIYSVDSGQTVYQSLEKMAAHDVGAVLIREGDKLMGIFTERDYMKKIVLKNRASATTIVKDVMTPNPVCVSPSDSVENGLAIITQKRLRHLPVIDDGKVVGIVSIGDLVKKKISDLNATIKTLNDYISGQGYQ